MLKGPWLNSGRLGILALFACLGVSRLAALGDEPEARYRPRLVLVYATCSVNKNYLAPYNRRVTYTPHLRAFAEHARVFARHQTEEGQSGIAFASLWTGTQAMRHGIYRHPERLDDSNYLMAEAFSEQGYETYFWDAHGLASADLNYGKGVKPEHVAERMLTVDDQGFAALLARLKKEPNLHAFVMTNHTVTHRPYKEGSVDRFCARYPTECRGLTVGDRAKFGKIFDESNTDLSYNFAETVSRLKLSHREVRALISVVELRYKSCISYLDDLFGGVVEAVARAGLLDQSLIVFTSDHGELLYRSNALFQWGHGFMLAPEDLSIPLMISGPGITPGLYEQVTRSIDVFPTVAGLSGFRLPDGRVMGVDLSPVFLKKVPPPPLVAYSHTSLVPKVFLEPSKALPSFHRLFPNDDIEGLWVAAREGDVVYKLRRLDGHDDQPEVYDWAKDSGETRNIFNPENPHHRVMFNNLRAYKQELIRAYLQSPQGRQTLNDKERIKRLRSLGYIH